MNIAPHNKSSRLEMVYEVDNFKSTPSSGVNDELVLSPMLMPDCIESLTLFVKKEEESLTLHSPI